MQGTISLGQAFPEFSRQVVVSSDIGGERSSIYSDSLKNEHNQWTLFFWWPKDFSFVGPTEIVEFNKAFMAFKKRNTRLLGASTDLEFVHKVWGQDYPDLKNLKFPMIVDSSMSLAKELGILGPNEKVAYRVSLIIDPEGIVRWIGLYDMNIGRSVSETLRVLDAIQNKELTPINWE